MLTLERNSDQEEILCLMTFYKMSPWSIIMFSKSTRASLATLLDHVQWVGTHYIYLGIKDKRISSHFTNTPSPISARNKVTTLCFFLVAGVQWMDWMNSLCTDVCTWMCFWNRMWWSAWQWRRQNFSDWLCSPCKQNKGHLWRKKLRNKSRKRFSDG